MIDLYPAIDLRGGNVVRLTAGDYNAETVYGHDPVAVAESFVAAGAKWIHVVDLDAAKSGDPVNRPVVARIAAAVTGQARLQTGGGIRTVADARQLAAAGVSRVVMGSAAMAEPELVTQVSNIIAVAVGLDHRDGDVAVHGWTSSSGVSVAHALTQFPAAAAFVITDISRDGRLSGPDIDGLTAAVAATMTPVIASGGVASLADLQALAAIEGLGGIIAGKAIYEDHFDVAAAIATLENRAES